MTEEGTEAEAPRRGGIVKAMIAGRDIAAPSALEPDRDTLGEIFGNRVVTPPYDFESLKRMWQSSSCLSPNTASYATNIDGLGHRLAPVLDLKSPDGRERIRESLWIERFAASSLDETGSGDIDPNFAPPLPTDEEVAAEIPKLETMIRIERVRCETFLRSCNPEGSFTSLRTITRHDLEITGNAYWEVLRNGAGGIARFMRIDPEFMRITPPDTTAVRVEDRVPVGLLSWETVAQHRFFRRYGQAIGTKAVWFKAFGDPRVVGRRSGRVYRDADEFKRRAQGDVPANEIIHFALPGGTGGYGIPRWIGNTPAVLGSRAADEVNYLYFDNKAVPPLALTVAGGELSGDSIKDIENYIRDNIKGRSNFHKILIVQALSDGAGDAKTPVIKFQPLTQAQQGDALFQNYDERNMDKVGGSFRLPRLLRGDIRDFNRATAEAALEHTDQQVFGPERQGFDDWWNRVVMPVLGVRFWEMRSLGVRRRDPQITANVLEKGSNAAAVTPNEARAVLSDALGTEFVPFDEDWARVPLPISQSRGVVSSPGMEPTTPAPAAPPVAETKVVEPDATGAESYQPQVRASDPGPAERRVVAVRGHSRSITARVAKSSGSGAMVALWLDEDIAKRVAVKGGEAPEDMHVTLAYLGKAAQIEPAALDTLGARLDQVASTRAPIVGVIAGVGVFSASDTSDGKDVVYLSVDAPALAELHGVVVNAIDETPNLERSKTHGFTPHITVAYVDAADVATTVNAVRTLLDDGPIPVTFDALWLAAGDSRTGHPFGSPS